ncbi:peptide deformylase [Fructilactobacillus hinvesii]|uniref:Peptide deformylase n=1 Tax=Fructilactobacillus hinvesii TaxID=2940300 RepID=A0ABY5BQE6_9LACO|nr:peptide deformylase [Fructilactobacillus hinvesii]USS87282.1 peptide deformylase [Fructilactobacillus hinvesii]
MYLMKDITRDGNPVLRQQAAPVKFPLSESDRELGENMMEYLEISQDEEQCKKHHLRAGVGLAAPQVGISKLMAAVLTPPEEEGQASPFKAIMVNPVIVSNSVQQAALSVGEGCLSVDKDIPGYVPRADRITVEYQDLDGEKHKVRLKHYPAIIVQHEIDHLHGTLFYDHINKQDPFAQEPNEIFIE